MTAGILPAARRRRAKPLPKFSRTSAWTLVSVSVAMVILLAGTRPDRVCGPRGSGMGSAFDSNASA